MRIKDVPTHNAYLVFHDAFDNGAMEIWGAESLELAEKTAAINNERGQRLQGETLMRLPKLESKLAQLTCAYFFATLFFCIGLASSLAFLVTAKWYAVALALAVCTGAWFILYKILEGITSAQNGQDAITDAPVMARTAPERAHFPGWLPGLK